MDDALRRAPDASAEAQRARPYLDAHEEAIAARMIGRPLQAASAAAVRCAWGLPAVLRVDPRTRNGTPFPTLFWLACPLANSHVGRLEAEGHMRGLNERLAADDELRRAYQDAAERFVALRDQLGEPLPGGPTAGGMPERVKCLHSLYAHELATGDNPIGAWVATQVEPLACPSPCVPAEDEI